MRALLIVLSLGTVALLAPPARADVPPDPNSVHAHCTRAEQCSEGVECDYAFKPGGKAGEAEKVGEECRKEVAAKGLERRCRNGGNYSGVELYCPKGATGTWSAGNGAPAPEKPVEAEKPVEPEKPVEAAKPVEPEKPVEAAKPVATPAEPARTGACSLHGEPLGAGLVVMLGVFARRRRR